MKVELVSYAHVENGISLFVVPETDIERSLLESLWRHGKLSFSNGVADRSGRGYCVKAFSAKAVSDE